MSQTFALSAPLKHSRVWVVPPGETMACWASGNSPVSTVEPAQCHGQGHPCAARGEGAAAGVHPD